MIYLGADHNGYFLKERIKRTLTRRALPWKDCGDVEYNTDDDYVDFANQVAGEMRSTDLGILACGSGHGMVIAANKHSGIRAIMPLDPRSARDGRHDDHANIVVLTAWGMSIQRAEKILMIFLKTKPGSAPRYLRRLNKLKKLDRIRK